MHQQDHHSTERELEVARIGRLGEILFLVEVGFMFTGFFLANGGFWANLVYHSLAIALSAFVLWSAHRASKSIPSSIPLQRPLGVTLCLLSHFLQHLVPAPLPMPLVAVCLIACPVSLVLLFEP